VNDPFWAEATFTIDDGKNINFDKTSGIADTALSSKFNIPDLFRRIFNIKISVASNWRITRWFPIVNSNANRH